MAREPASMSLLLRWDGDDFEIVGHEVPSSELRGQAAARAGSGELESVERLLGERREAFETEVVSYLWENWAKRAGNYFPDAGHFRLLGFKVLARRGDAYEVRVTIDKSVTHPQGGGGAEQFILSLRLDGEDFEIVGYKRL